MPMAASQVLTGLMESARHKSSTRKASYVSCDRSRLHRFVKLRKAKAIQRRTALALSDCGDDQPDKRKAAHVPARDLSRYTRRLVCQRVFGRQKGTTSVVVAEAAVLLKLLDGAASVPIGCRRGDGTSQERQGKER